MDNLQFETYRKSTLVMGVCYIAVVFVCLIGK